ncbi:hypothetical protein V8E53_008579, partial [Lactarius tabidus]
AAVLKRLQEDEEYFSTISPLACISIFRAKVKECVNAFTSGTFQSMSSPMKVAESIVLSYPPICAKMVNYFLYPQPRIVETSNHT